MRSCRSNFTGIIPVVLFLGLIIFVTSRPVKGQKEDDCNVKVTGNDEKKGVDIYINGSLFTSYRFPENMEKPILYPVISPNGSVITRGFPIEPRKGERVDHPHHTGIWFNHGNVNGLDFWNNSSAIPADKKDHYGHISHQKIIKTESGKKGVLEVVTNWNDNKGETLLRENTTYIFAGDANTRTIDHITTLTAVNGKVIINDSKEGMFAIRLDRAFEMPSDEPLIFTDDKGIPTAVEVTDNAGVTGMYYSSSGLKGDKVWGTRNNWVLLSGIKDNVRITIGIFDHPGNPGYPAYAHARGYGLFSVNNFGRNSYDPRQTKLTYVLEKGQSVKICHRFYLQSGAEITPESADMIFKDFSEKY